MGAIYGELVMRYWITIHRPDGYDPSVAEDEPMGRDIDRLNEEMVAAGIRVFVGGLQPPDRARSVRWEPGGGVAVSDGPYLSAGEHVGGFWVLEATDLDAALAWGRKAAIACRAAVEVRPFH